MDLQLQGQVAVVVGAASGIGRAIAETFAAEGAHVVLSDISPRVEAIAQEIATAHGVRALGLIADVTDSAAMQDVAQQSVAQMGQVDHLVYAAGMGSGKGGFPFWNLQPSDWPRVLDVNLVGAVNSAHAFAPHFSERRQGTIAFISSVAGQIGSQTDPPYSAAKAGLINFSICAAKDLAAYGVRVNTINPGMVDTPLNRGVWEGQMKNLPESERVDFEAWGADKLKRVVPLNRWQTAQDIANMVVFVASPRAHNVTGQTINVDGGFVMHW
ncbi:MAG: SDR family oxidoreductase [Litorilinea sp.]